MASDNGGNPIDGGNNWPLRGAKKDYYQGGIHVPAFIYSPLLDNSQGGQFRKYDSLFHVSDWLPTFVHGVAQLTTSDQTFDGVNQWDAIYNGVKTYRDAPRSEILNNIDYIDSDTDAIFTDATDANAALVANLDGTVYKIIINFRGDSNGVWYKPSSNDGDFLEGSISSETESGMNYGNETCFVFDLENDPFEQINLWDKVPFQKVKKTLSKKVCEYWENKMVDSLYHDDVSGNGKRTLVQAFEANDDYITWWDDGTVNQTSKFRMQDLDTKGACPFKGLEGDITDLPGNHRKRMKHKKSMKEVGSALGDDAAEDTEPMPWEAPYEEVATR